MPNVLYAAGSIQEFRTDDANVLLPPEAYNADIVALPDLALHGRSHCDT
jgi:hypothetical protein